MAYSQPIGSNGKASTFVVVAGLHAVAIYAIVTGLTVSWRDKPIPKNPTGIFVPTENEKLPEPSPSASMDPTLVRDHIPVPLPPVGGTPPAPFDFGSVGSELGSGGGLAGVELPHPLIEPIKPSFTAKAPRPRGRIGDWVRQSDYPSVGLHQEHQGLTRVQLSISVAGKVTGCTVTGTSGYEELDQATCANLSRRGKFEPATDGSGEVASGTFNTSVRWQLPE